MNVHNIALQKKKRKRGGELPTEHSLSFKNARFSQRKVYKKKKRRLINMNLPPFSLPSAQTAPPDELNYQCVSKAKKEKKLFTISQQQIKY